jgi:hypothetical protein
MNVFAHVALRAITLLVVGHHWPGVALVVAGIWALYDGTRTEFGKLVATWFLTLVLVVLVEGGQLLDHHLFGWVWVFLGGTVIAAVLGAAVGSLFAEPDLT